MSFFSIPFLIFFLPFVLVHYYLLGILLDRVLKVANPVRFQNGWLLVASIVFLVWLEPVLLLLFAVLVGLCLFLSRKITKAIWEGKRPQPYLLTGYIVFGSIFLLFQIGAALISNGLPLFGLEYTLFRTLLPPAGIAVLCLRSISYVTDVYGGKIEAEKNVVNLGLYLCFFPQVIVGPLQSYRDFKVQLNRSFSMELLSDGVCRFVIGLGKKILIAGNLAVVSDQVFGISQTSESLTQVPVSLAWLGMIVFFLQIYYDFSSFTDMAIGMSNMLGFTIPENFNYPYMADSMTSFWDRWLITIKKWFDRYVSRPLNRMRERNNDQVVVNTFFAFLAMGIWHRVSIGVLIWALLQVICITVEQVISYNERRISKFIKHLYVMLIVMFGWVLLRYGNFYETLLFLRNMVGANQNGLASPLALSLLKEYWIWLVAAVIFIFPVAPKLRQRMEASSHPPVRKAAVVLYPVLLSGVAFLCLLYLTRGLYTPVTYFSF